MQGFPQAVRAMLLATLLLPIATLALAVPAAHAATTGWSGYATATVVHADLLQSGTTRVVDAEEGFSAASASTSRLRSAILNEVERPASPALANRSSYARGSGLEAGLVQSPSTENQLILAGKAESFAPPSTGLATKELGPVKGSPLLYASALRGQAVANWGPGGCVLGKDVARGLGYALDAQLLNTGEAAADGTLKLPILTADAPRPERAVAQSSSRLRLIRQIDKTGRVVGPRFALLSETRATIAPITLFRDTPTQITLEFLGEWVLQAVATGVPGQAWVHYGPGKVTPETPVLRTLDVLGNVTNILTTQQLLTPAGLVLKVPGVAEIAIGEDPRAIGGDDTTSPVVAANGTAASAAVDVVRVKLLASADLHAADIRVGHMEVRAAVPEGGIACGLPVRKVATPASVSVGNDFTTTITVTNPYDCPLANVKLHDAIHVEGDARFAIASTSPTGTATAGDNLSEGTIDWDLGGIPAHGSKKVAATFTAQDGAGKIVDVATATGDIGACTGSATTVSGVGTALVGADVGGSSPELTVPVAKVLGKIVSRDQLPATGLEDVLPVAAGALAVIAAGLLIGLLRKSA